MTTARRSAAMAALLFIAVFLSAAERFGFGGLPASVTVDLPEGFKLADGDGKKSFHLKSSIVKADVIIQIFDKGKYPDAREAVAKTVSRLKLSAPVESSPWLRHDAALSALRGKIGGEDSAGYAAAAVIPETEQIIFIMAWCPSTQADLCGVFLASVIDSLCVDMQSRFSPGLLTSLAFPESGKSAPLELEIGGTKVSTRMDSIAKEAADYLVEREYAVLKLYDKTAMLVDALKRYYRMIFRDSCGRLMQASFDIGNALAPGCADETELAQRLLTWTQGFKYEREKTESDFVSLPSVLLGEGSDCDSRSMLLCVLLQSLNQEAALFISGHFSHALAGFVSTHPGFSFQADGKKYLVGDTTITGLTWGRMDQNQADQSKWVTVTFP